MEEREDREEDAGIINTISGGLAAGGSSGRARKAYAKEVYITSQPPDKKSKTVPVAAITFSDEDSKGIQTPHDDPLVIIVRAGNFDVKRVLIDNGSFAEILFYDAFKKMNIPTDRLRKMDTPLYGFSNHPVVAEGIIALPVVIGTPPAQANFILDFVVVKVPSAYNAILGRPALNHIIVGLAKTLCPIRVINVAKNILSEQSDGRTLCPNRVINVVKNILSEQSDGRTLCPNRVINVAKNILSEQSDGRTLCPIRVINVAKNIMSEQSDGRTLCQNRVINVAKNILSEQSDGRTLCPNRVINNSLSRRRYHRRENEVIQEDIRKALSKHLLGLRKTKLVNLKAVIRTFLEPFVPNVSIQEVADALVTSLGYLFCCLPLDSLQPLLQSRNLSKMVCLLLAQLFNTMRSFLCLLNSFSLLLSLICCHLPRHLKARKHLRSASVHLE
ncbi:hypothetical protein RJ639_017098 [Escallonia herrerae]|uniref:Uncharacterized protein n=1 Tax=Escallonia herrerae TaxID=1293975 RepID=A0AA89ALK2_9ASTE|nr:hypothetical protein RJ639_017098 [Escallonia herrerae]